MKPTRLYCICMVVFAALFLASCGKASQTENSGTPAYKTEIIIAGSQEPPSIDLHKNSSAVARNIGRGTIWEQIVTMNEASEVVPELAERYEVNEDLTVHTFYLRSGVKFHDGSVMTADDVVASMNRWIESFSTAKSIFETARFIKVDDLTVQVTLTKGMLTLPLVIAGATQPAAIMPARVFQNLDANGFVTEYIGTGPYEFTDWKLNQYMELTKFNDYVPYGNPDEPLDGWSGYKHAYLEKIYFYFVPEGSTRVAGLETGQFDVISDLTFEDYAHITSIPGLRTMDAEGGEVALVFNKRAGLMADPLMRKAFNALVNSEDLLLAAFGAKQYKLSPSYMNSSTAFWQTMAGEQYYNLADQDLAKKYLAEAGYDGVTPIRILASPQSNYDKMALVLEQALAQIGVPAALTIVDWATFTQYRSDPQRYDIYITSFGSVPIPTLKLYFGTSYPGWSDDETLQTYLKEFGEATTLEQAKAIWEKTQLYCWEEYLPAVIVGNKFQSYAYNEKVEGLALYQNAIFWNTQVRQ